MVMAPIGGRISDLIGVRIPATVGLTLISMSIFSFIFIERSASEYQILWRQVALGVGIGLFNPANNSAIIGSLPKAKVGLASSFLALARNLGIVIGVAFAEMIIALGGSSVSLETEGTPLIQSIHYVWKLVLILGLVAIFISWMRDRRSLADEKMVEKERGF
jgi:MFS family permease